MCNAVDHVAFNEIWNAVPEEKINKPADRDFEAARAAKSLCKGCSATVGFST